MQQPLFQPERAVHPRLLGGREERFQRTVYQRIVLQHGQNGRRADAVVRTERRAVGRHPLAVDIGVDRIFREVELLVVVLLGHHVEVGLQDHALAVLHAFRGGFADIDVMCGVLLAFESFLPCEIHDVFADLLLVRRGARNAYDLSEMLPDQRRLQGREIACVVHKSRF